MLEVNGHAQAKFIVTVRTYTWLSCYLIFFALAAFKHSNRGTDAVPFTVPRIILGFLDIVIAVPLVNHFRVTQFFICAVQGPIITRQRILCQLCLSFTLFSNNIIDQLQILISSVLLHTKESL